jgi:hypothetical protein
MDVSGSGLGRVGPEAFRMGNRGYRVACRVCLCAISAEQSAISNNRCKYIYCASRPVSRHEHVEHMYRHRTIAQAEAFEIKISGKDRASYPLLFA